MPVSFTGTSSPEPGVISTTQEWVHGILATQDTENHKQETALVSFNVKLDCVNLIWFGIHPGSQWNPVLVCLGDREVLRSMSGLLPLAAGAITLPGQN